jgi:putative membrane protein
LAIETEQVMAYLWIKTFHIVFVIAWMASVFYLPRILVNIAEAGDAVAVRERLALMGKRLYSFGHMMFGLAAILGVTLWMQYGVVGAWLHAKLGLVTLLFVYFILCGRMLKRAAVGGALPSAKTLRWINELPVLLLVAIVYLVLAKPF